MNYKSIERNNQDLILTNINHFDLAQTLDCGQAFRWSETDGIYSGIAYGRRMELLIKDNNLTIKNCSEEEFNTRWKHYFDLNRDYTTLHTQLSEEENIKKALAFSPGLRLMNQDPWETLVSFILSQNTNIPRIKKMISGLCEAFGEKLPCGSYTFPAPEKIATLDTFDLSPIKCGYRASYIIDAAKQVANGKVDIIALNSQPTQIVRQALLGIHGVGPQVADCVLLYGFGRIECYPVDVWIKRITEELYPNGFPEILKEQAGIAQLFLFQYVRNRQ